MGQETGLIVMHAGSVAPPGWALCDGTAHGSADLQARINSPLTPDLRDKFIRGAGATPLRTTGGRQTMKFDVAEMPNHNHGGATVAGGGGHNHTGTTTSNTRGNMAHTHTGTTTGENFNHSHSSPQVLTGTVSAWHTHNINVNEGSGTGDGGNYVDTNPSADGAGRPNVGVTNGQSVDHVHASVAVTTGGVSANHVHSTVITATNIDHTHAFTSGGASAAHQHTITPVGSGTPINLVPVHYALTFIICL
jgi:microcystin-dependent protein